MIFQLNLYQKPLPIEVNLAVAAHIGYLRVGNAGSGQPQGLHAETAQSGELAKTTMKTMMMLDSIVLHVPCTVLMYMDSWVKYRWQFWLDTIITAAIVYIIYKEVRLH